jgi:Flp pilus assembly protein TadG
MAGRGGLGQTLGTFRCRQSTRLSSAVGDAGQALVEFALVVPLFLVLVLGVVSFGTAYNNYENLTDAVRAAAREAAAQPNQTQACNAARTSLQSTGGAITPQNVQCANTTVNGDPAVTLSADYPYSIRVFGLPVHSGNLSASATERVG